MYPFKFNPILKSTIWGGEKIIPFKHLNIEQPQVGESWEISNVPGDESVVANGTEAGKNLSQLVKEYKGSLVGESNYQRFGDNFPLLIKFIDACDDLSIQVHPDDELAKKRHNSMGKTEMWYVIDNAGGKAHLRSGLSKKITPDEYAAMIADNTICDALADYAVQPGDVFFLPAGRIHSIGAGCFIAEIQQTSNVTYRIYDFNRKDKNGNTRELHTELSKDAIQYIEADTVGAKGSGDIHISPDGKFLYASNRLKADGIAIFSINQEEGTLTKTGYQLTGIHPRNFIISRNGRYLLVACRDSNSIQVFERDSQTGLLKDTGKTIKTNKPVCLKFTF